MSLRVLGLRQGLGHELLLMLRSDPFIVTASGFATMANFSGIPYFTANVTQESCKAYRVALGSERLPFATERQILLYEPETPMMLIHLLERGLEGVPPRKSTPGPPSDGTIDARSCGWEQAQ